MFYLVLIKSVLTVNQVGNILMSEAILQRYGIYFFGMADGIGTLGGCQSVFEDALFGKKPDRVSTHVNIYNILSFYFRKAESMKMIRCSGDIMERVVLRQDKNFVFSADILLETGYSF